MSLKYEPSSEPHHILCTGRLDAIRKGGKAGLVIRKHDHFTPARKMRRDVRALTARNHSEGRVYPMERHALQDQLL